VPEAPWKQSQIVGQAETLFRSFTWMDSQPSELVDVP
jgi:hypothetical protein